MGVNECVISSRRVSSPSRVSTASLLICYYVLIQSCDVVSASRYGQACSARQVEPQLVLDTQSRATRCKAAKTTRHVILVTMKHDLRPVNCCSTPTYPHASSFEPGSCKTARLTSASTPSAASKGLPTIRDKLRFKHKHTTRPPKHILSLNTLPAPPRHRPITD